MDYTPFTRCNENPVFRNPRGFRIPTCIYSSSKSNAGFPKKSNYSLTVVKCSFIAEKPILDTVGDHILKNESSREVDEEKILSFISTPDERVTSFVSTLHPDGNAVVSMENDVTGKYSQNDGGPAELSDAVTYVSEVVYTYKGVEYQARSEPITVAVNGNDYSFLNIVL